MTEYWKGNGVELTRRDKSGTEGTKKEDRESERQEFYFMD